MTEGRSPRAWYLQLYSLAKLGRARPYMHTTTLRLVPSNLTLIASLQQCWVTHEGGNPRLSYGLTAMACQTCEGRPVH